MENELKEQQINKFIDSLLLKNPNISNDEVHALVQQFELEYDSKAKVPKITRAISGEIVETSPIEGNEAEPVIEADELVNVGVGRNSGVEENIQLSEEDENMIRDQILFYKPSYSAEDIEEILQDSGQRNVYRAIGLQKAKADALGADASFAKQARIEDNITNLEASLKSPDEFLKSVRLTGANRVPIEERYDDSGWMPPKVQEALFPRMSDQVKTGGGLGGKQLSGMLDVSSLPGRVIESAAVAPFQEGGTYVDKLKKRMGQVETGNMLSDVVRAPENILGFGGLGKLGIAGTKYIPKLASGFGKAVKTGLKEAAVQAPISGLSQYERNLREGTDIDVSEMGWETGIAAALPVSLDIVKNASKGVGKFTKDYFMETVKQSDELANKLSKTDKIKSGVKEYFSGNPTKKVAEIKDYSEGVESVSEQVVDFVDSFDKNFINSSPDMAKFFDEKGIQKATKGYDEIIGEHHVITGAQADIGKEIDQFDKIIPTIKEGLDETKKKALDKFRKEFNAELELPQPDGMNKNEFLPSSLINMRSLVNRYPASKFPEMKRMKKEALKVIDAGLEKLPDNDSERKLIKKYMSNSNLAAKISNSFTGGDASKAKNLLKQLGESNKPNNLVQKIDVEKLLGKDVYEALKLQELAKEHKGMANIYNDLTSPVRTNLGKATDDITQTSLGAGGKLLGALGTDVIYPMMRGSEKLLRRGGIAQDVNEDGSQKLNTMGNFLSNLAK